MKQSILLAALAASASAADCPNYEQYARVRHTPFSCGKYKLPYQRPAQECRSYIVPEVERTIKDMKKKIRDPDLYRLFLNNWPNTVDTTVLWRGHAADNADEELAFVVTGDINAMWLRDSANQLQSYKPVLNATVNNGENDIASLYRGVINLHARYVKKYPYCNSFQPPAESKIPPVHHRKRSLQKRGDTVNPPYDPNEVWECKYELDSLAAFLQLSWDYFEATGDGAFFGKFHWKEAVKTVLDVADGMMEGTYTEDGIVNKSPYTWLRDANSATETVSNNGAGNPVEGHIGMVRSFFRPSDDSTTYQYFVPANMMFARNLQTCATIMEKIDGALAKRMSNMASGIHKGIDAHARINHPKYGEIYAYEVDGLGSVNFMDDANVPSLLSIPHLGYEGKNSDIYKRTRDYVLSRSNPYYCYGPVINATGGPHQGPGQAWPMAVIMQIMTSDDDNEIVHGIKQLLGSTSGLGLIHESVNSHDENHFSRSWFAWAAGLAGQMLLDLADRKPALLERSYQN